MRYLCPALLVRGLFLRQSLAVAVTHKRGVPGGGESAARASIAVRQRMGWRGVIRPGRLATLDQGVGGVADGGARRWGSCEEGPWREEGERMAGRVVRGCEAGSWLRTAACGLAS